MAFMKKTETGDKDGRRTGRSLGAVQKDVQKSTQKSVRPVQNVWLVGIDEVGRGPLAGPVTVGAVAVLMEEGVARTYVNLRKKLMEISGTEYPIGIDSKKMKERDRDFWSAHIVKLSRTEKDSNFIINVESKSAKDIDQKGIAVCISHLVDLNIKKILKKIQKTDPDAQLSDLYILLDGSLKTKLLVGNQKTIIKGDEKEILISLASVHAKVTRDTYMKKVSKDPKYRVYGFEIHKGYGTTMHRDTIRKSGKTDEHRLSFCNNI